MGSCTSGITSIVAYSFLRNIMTCVRNICRIKRGFQYREDFLKGIMESLKAGVYTLAN